MWFFPGVETKGERQLLKTLFSRVHKKEIY